MMKITSLVILALLLGACTPDNEHFCMRYEYVYDQLNEPDVPSYAELKEALQNKLDDPEKDKDQPKFMLFVLEEFHIGAKPDHEAAQDYCMRTKRWTRYN